MVEEVKVPKELQDDFALAKQLFNAVNTDFIHLQQDFLKLNQIQEKIFFKLIKERKPKHT